MGLTTGSAPFGQRRAGEFNFERPRDHVLYLEPSPRRVRVEFKGEIVADSTRARLLHETGHLPVYYFPAEDVRTDLLEPSDKSTTCPVKGDASYRTLRVGDEVAEDAVWTYEDALDDAPDDLAGLMAFYWDAVDAWYEEDERIGVHPRDPYHRVDVLHSSRHVKVNVDGEVVAESERPVVLFETGLPARFYLPREDVRAELLVDSDTHTECPYKGTASYFSLKTGDDVREDFAWYYPEPYAGVDAIKDRVCFYNEKVDLEVDSERWERPVTKFS